MCFCQSYIILLTIVTGLILNTDRVKAKRQIFDCKGKLLDLNVVGARKGNRIFHNLKKIVIPERFDAREKWQFCKSLHHIKYQGKCSGCWAFAAASVMSDRLCIATRGKYDKPLSEQDLMECCRSCVSNSETYIGGCNGGSYFAAFDYWKDHGVVTGEQSCKPIDLAIVEGTPQKECRPKCTNATHSGEYEKDKTFGMKSFKQYSPANSDIRHIMAEIMLKGPVVGSMNTYDYMIDRLSPDTILIFNESLLEKNEKPEPHAIKIIGWDKINGTPVWIFANSWGKSWCNEGFCYIRRGYNDFFIENYPIATGTPLLKNQKVVSNSNSKKKKFKEIHPSGSNIINITNSVKVVVDILVMLCIIRA